MDPKERLKALGINLGPKNIAPPADEKDLGEIPIEKVISGQELSTIYGETFITIQDFPHPYQHGAIDLSHIPDLKIIAEWGKSPRIKEIDIQKIGFLDTETSGLAGGTGTYAFLIGLGYHIQGYFRVVQFFMRDPSREPTLLAALDEWLTPFQALVTFNGKSFDIPLLKTRFSINGLTPPFSTYEHLDLLHLARRLWRDRLASRAMGDLEKEIIGFIRDKEEVPGYLIPQYYFDYLRTGDARPLEGVFYHNAQDIVSLAALFNYMASILEAPHRDPLPSLDVVSIAKLYEELGYLEQAAELFERSLSQGLPQDFFIKTIHRFALLRRKQGNLELWCSSWQKAAEYHDLDAHIELAKYYEHQLRDILEALRWSNKAMQELSGLGLSGIFRRNMTGELKKRIQRLENKAGRGKERDMDDTGFVSVYTAEGKLAAEIIRLMLELFGIQAVLFQESVGAAYGLTVGTGRRSADHRAIRPGERRPRAAPGDGKRRTGTPPSSR